MKDSRGEVIYVGKAVSIRKRVGSHFSGKGRSSPDMLRQVRSFDFVVTETEAEALLAEQQLIKRHRPRFNIRLRDDKSYPYIGISLDEEFPRVYFTRERHRPGRVYFGPYASAKRTRETLELLGKLFQYRTCEGPDPGRRSGVPCLDYYIKRCQAPCVGYIDRAEYRRNVEAIAAFLSGRYRDVERDLESKMEEASRGEQFERAAVLRDRLAAVRSLMQRQRVAGDSLQNVDVIGVAVDGRDANAQVFQVRDGVLAERQSFYLANEGERSEAEVIEEFLAQYYSAVPAIPRLIVVGSALAGREGLVSEALAERRGGSVEVRVAERGDKRRLREMAERNAKLALAQDKLRRERSRQQRVDALADLSEALGLETLPVRIEGFDISNLGSEHTVASMVVFEGGAPKKSDYRRFRIRGDRADGPDDFASMEEVLSPPRGPPRRPDRPLTARSSAGRELCLAPRRGPDRRWQGPAGRGHAPARRARRARRDRDQPGEEARGGLRAGPLGPLPVPADSEASRLLQRVRDEAHRFAIEHHRKRRDASMRRSLLDELPGVGPARKRALLVHFGSPERVANASREELEAVPGIPGKLARDIHRQLNRTG